MKEGALSESTHQFRAAEGAEAGSNAFAGLVAGLIGSLIVVLVSLPLHSPHDSLMNSGTISVVALLTSAVLGLVWHIVGRTERGTQRFVAICAAVFGTAVVGAFLVETVAGLERSVSFIVPLAAIQLGVTATFTPVLSTNIFTFKWVVVLLAAALLVTGFGLAGQGDQESGRLELPPRSE